MSIQDLDNNAYSSTGGQGSILETTILTSPALTEHTILSQANFTAVNLNSDLTDRYARIDFVVPSSGNVKLTMNFSAKIINSATVLHVAINSDTTPTETPICFYRIGTDDDSTHTSDMNATFYLRGLTAGESKTYYFMTRANFSSSVIRCGSCVSSGVTTLDQPHEILITASDMGLSTTITENPSS